MFTGLVSAVGEIVSLEKHKKGAIIKIAAPKKIAEMEEGASIACSGACMTVVRRGVGEGADQNIGWFDVEVSPESLARTTIKDWKKGQKINLERPLRPQDEMGGHFLTGHIDGLCRILSLKDEGDFWRAHLQAPKACAHLIASKGSVALDGVSLTVNSIQDDVFDIMIIPHTFRMTNWSGLQEGDHVNLEVDLFARYAARILESKGLKSKGNAS